MKACDLCRNKDRGECAVYKPCALAKLFKLMEEVLRRARPIVAGVEDASEGHLNWYDASISADAKGQGGS